ncbi:hypothetical protein JW848_05925 [Candidatus Bipolaricaulota bacterium]|nr:hypothetical protein [Candidatus Bipolaricaulota bacterium]
MRRWMSVVVLFVVLALGAVVGCDLLFVDHSPVAVFDVFHPVEEEPLVVTLDAGASYDEDEDPIIAYLWAITKLGGDIGDGVEYYPLGWTTDNVTEEAITIEFPVEGTYTVQLQVRSSRNGVVKSSEIVARDVIVPGVPVAPTV